MLSTLPFPQGKTQTDFFTGISLDSLKGQPQHCEKKPRARVTTPRCPNKARLHCSAALSAGDALLRQGAHQRSLREALPACLAQTASGKRPMCPHGPGSGRADGLTHCRQGCSTLQPKGAGPGSRIQPERPGAWLSRRAVTPSDLAKTPFVPKPQDPDRFKDLHLATGK